MKILVCHRPDGAFGFISDSWIKAFADCGLNVQRWDGNPHIWQSFNPNLYIGCSGHVQKIPSKKYRGRCKVAIHVNPYGPVKIEPNINEQQKSIDWVLEQEPEVVFGYGFEKDRDLWSSWEKHNIKWQPMATAGDVTLYSPDPDSKHFLDISYIGGYWPYKAQNIDKYLLPILKDNNLKKMVMGWGKWPIKINNDIVRECSYEQKLQAFQQSKVCPCISEPHTSQYGIDVPERVFKVILSGALAIHDNVKDIKEAIPSVVLGKDPSDYREKIYKFIKDGTKRNDRWKEQYKDVISNHTYHHRLSGLLSALEFGSFADQMLKCVKEKYEF